MKQPKRTIAAKIAEKTGLSTSRAQEGVQTVLDCIKQALADGKKVDLGKKLGKLVVVERKPTRKIVNYLRGQTGKGQKEKTIGNLYHKHPRTVRFLGRGRDLSQDPKPAIITKFVKRSVAIAFPSWRRRFR